jgi:hypothetical protein
MDLFLTYVLALFLSIPVPPRPLAPTVRFLGNCPNGKSAEIRDVHSGHLIRPEKRGE